MRTAVFATICGLLFLGFVQEVDPKKEWKEYWDHLNEEFKDPDQSPLTKEDRKKFKRLETFDYNPQMRIVATFATLDSADAFKMKTSTARTPLYKTVGKLEFQIGDVQEELFVYQNIKLSESEEYKNYLFVPFTDLTNYEETYGGGRYLDLEGPLGTELVLEFNKAYNPYCAYSGRYSCPIPPLENHLSVKITAGVLVFNEHEKH